MPLDGDEIEGFAFGTSFTFTASKRDRHGVPLVNA
jgi:hypothetical protein